MDVLVSLAIYIVFFEVLHSLTAAKFFKKKVYQFIEPGAYRFIYTIVSVVTVLPILYLWFTVRNASSAPLYTIGFPLNLVMYLFIIAGFYLVLKSLILIDPLDFIGLKAVFKIKPAEKSSGLITGGVYQITRHPLYLGGILILWSSPQMHTVDILVNTLFTLYFILGGVLEERKLEEEFGDVYTLYKKNVSMLIPVKWIRGFIRG